MFCGAKIAGSSPARGALRLRRGSARLPGVGSMNKFSIAGMFKGLAMAGLLALIMPSTSLADDHLLSINGATVSQNMVITDAGAITTPLILTNFDGNPTLSFGQNCPNLTVTKTPVKMCKPGTKGNLEWLDQGNTVIGVAGVVTSANNCNLPNNAYQLTLSFAFNSTYSSSNGACSISGQKSYTSTMGALIEQKQMGNLITKLTSTYNFWNTNTIPEPGTVLLMLTGLLVLGWMSMKRMRTARGVST
jgi:hypothetical protein